MHPHRNSSYFHTIYGNRRNARVRLLSLFTIVFFLFVYYDVVYRPKSLPSTSLSSSSTSSSSSLMMDVARQIRLTASSSSFSSSSSSSQSTVPQDKTDSNNEKKDRSSLNRNRFRRKSSSSSSSSSSSTTTGSTFPRSDMDDVDDDDIYDAQLEGVTLVTSWFRLDGRSKYSFDAYDSWLRNSIASLRTPLIIYTTPDQVNYLRSLRGNLTAKYVLYNSINEIPSLIPYLEQYNTQKAKDPDGAIHSRDLYLVWNAKPYMVAEAARYNFFRSKYIFWLDMGVFRSKPFVDWPAIQPIDEALDPYPCRILMINIGDLELNGKLRTSPYNYLGVIGGFYGGRPKAVIWFARAFALLHHYYINQEMFVGIDQVIFNTLVSWKPERFALLQSKNPASGCHTDALRARWFWFQNVYAHPWEKPKLYICHGPFYVLMNATLGYQERNETLRAKLPYSRVLDSCPIHLPVLPQVPEINITFPHIPKTEFI